MVSKNNDASFLSDVLMIINVFTTNIYNTFFPMSIVKKQSFNWIPIGLLYKNAENGCLVSVLDLNVLPQVG